MVEVAEQKLVLTIKTGPGSEVYRQQLVNSLIEILKAQDPELMTANADHHYNVLELIQRLNNVQSND